MDPSSTRHRIDSLTGLRFLAAAVVVVCHSRGGFGIPKDWGEPFQFYQAVSFFFVLSGFILTYVYPRLDDWGQRRRFLLARFARIWPAHAAGMLFLILTVPRLIPAEHALPRGLFQLAMLHSWIPLQETIGDYNTISWSISTEFGFYCLFPILIVGFDRTWAWKLLLTALLTLGCIGLWKYLSEDSLSSHSILRLAGRFFYIHPLARLFEFVAGMVTALAWQRWTPRLEWGRLVGTIVEALAVAALMYVAYSTKAIVWRLPTNGGWLDASRHWLRNGGLCCLPFCLLIFIMALERGWISFLLGTWPIVLLGEISYTIYLFHLTLLILFKQHMEVFGRLPRALVYGAFWVTLLILSHFIWSTVEHPLRRLILGWRRGNLPAVAEDSGSSRPAGLRGPLFKPGRLLRLGELVVLLTILVGVGSWKRPGTRQRAADSFASGPAIPLMSPDQSQGEPGAEFSELLQKRMQRLFALPDARRNEILDREIDKWQAARGLGKAGESISLIIRLEKAIDHVGSEDQALIEKFLLAVDDRRKERGLEPQHPDLATPALMQD
jgi:peptidoglycan/LPS O-acetylase OafA/YrhL